MKRMGIGKKIILLLLVLGMLVSGMPGRITGDETVYGATKLASSGTMKKAYYKYLKKYVSRSKKYAIVNIEENNRPALLVSSGKSTAYSSDLYLKCTVYYYVSGKVKKIGKFDGFSRPVTLTCKNGQYYIYGGGSDTCYQVRIKNNKLYKYCFYNNRNWREDPSLKWKKSRVYLGSRVVKSYGYLDNRQYYSYCESYKYLGAVRFQKNL